MNTFITLLESNFFGGFITLLVGGVAIALYKKQKIDYKRDVALLILQEIRYAEQQIRSSQAFSPNAENFPLSSKLLPTNSWYKNIHLFMGDFKQPQIDAISRFYAQVEYIDLVIEKISNYKIQIIEQVVSDLSGREMQRAEILPERMYLYNIANSLASPRNQLSERISQANDLHASSLPATGSQAQIPQMVNILIRLKANNILKDVTTKIEFIYNTPIGENLRKIGEKKWLLFF